jgi:stress response protein YsnF
LLPVSDSSNDDSAILQRAEESARVDVVEKDREVVRVRVSPRERLQTVTAELQQQRVVVERVPRNEVVDAPPATRREGSTLIIPVLEERLVVERRLVLVEELHLSTRVDTHVESRIVPVRVEEVVVERSDTGPQNRSEEPLMSPSSTDIARGEKSGPNRTVAAYYDDDSAADRAIEQLRAAGIQNDSIHRVQAPRDQQLQQGGGLFHDLKRLFLPDSERAGYEEGVRRGGVVLAVRSSEGEIDQIIEILETTGPADIDQRQNEWRDAGWTGQAGTGAGATGADATGAGATGAGATGATDATRTTGTTGERDETIPVVEEELRVGKREVGRGSVRVRSWIVEQPVEASVQLREEHVEVERRPVDRPVGATEQPFEERTIEAVERAEEAVVQKTARVKEEIAVRKDAEERTETVRDKVRRTEVEVEQGDKNAAKGDPLKRAAE